MVRQFGALFLITAAAPYLVLLWMLVLGPWPIGLLGPTEYRKVLHVGTFGLMIYGLPVLLVSACVFLGLKNAGCITWLSHVLSGCLIGFYMMLDMTARFINVPALISFEASSSDIDDMRTVGACVGAISGWIYWCIAIRDREDVNAKSRQEAC